MTPTDDTAVLSLSAGQLQQAVAQLLHRDQPRYRRLWAYYRNPMCAGPSAISDQAGCDRPYRQAQEWGLPARITGVVAGDEPFCDAAVTGRSRKEVVIENDIGWRVDTMVEYLFGKTPVIVSAAPEEGRRKVITALLDRILAHHGGISFLQQMALVGCVHGFVDVLVKLDPAAVSTANQANKIEQSPLDPLLSGAHAGAGPARPPQPLRGRAAEATDLAHPGSLESAEAPLERISRMIRLEIVEPARALPLLSSDDWRQVEAYGQVWEKASADKSAAPVGGGLPRPVSWWQRLRGALGGNRGEALLGRQPGQSVQVVELITPSSWVRLEDGKVTTSGVNSLGEIPLVHVQNSAVPRSYPGAGDVEPLIPLQDELNTRLSDRAHRITLQSFKMYLGKGIEQFNDLPVAPGRMWMTDNEQAEVIEFGGDASCPSESAHIADLREALDKTSGVTPIAAGAIKDRIGRLTSAAALRITLLALLSKTDRKRTLYGAGIARICALALKWLDAAGVFHTTPEERQIEINWPSPLPENEIEKLQEARAKLDLGVEQAVVLRELGY